MTSPKQPEYRCNTLAVAAAVGPTLAVVADIYLPRPKDPPSSPPQQQPKQQNQPKEWARRFRGAGRRRARPAGHCERSRLRDERLRAGQQVNPQICGFVLAKEAAQTYVTRRTKLPGHVARKWCRGREERWDARSEHLAPNARERATVVRSSCEERTNDEVG